MEVGIQFTVRMGLDLGLWVELILGLACVYTLNEAPG